MGKYRDAWLLIQKQIAQTKQNRELFELIDECVLTYEDIIEAKDAEVERTCARYELAEEEDD